MSEQDAKVRQETVTPDPDEIPQYARPAVRMMPGPATAEPEDEPAPHSKRRRWTLTAMAVLGAGAVAAAATLGPTLVRITQQKDAKLTMPEKIGALVRDDSRAAKDTADYLRTALAADIDLDTTASAIYTDPAEGATKSVLVFGGTTTMFSPERELDTVFKLMEDETGGVTGLTRVRARRPGRHDEVRLRRRPRRRHGGLRLGRPRQHRPGPLPRPHPRRSRPPPNHHPHHHPHPPLTSSPR